MRRRASEQGAVAPASLLAAAVLAVAIGTAGYAMTSGPTETDQQPAAQVQTKPTVKPSATPTPTKHVTHVAPVINRGNYNLAIYNNTSIQGLAARTSTKAQTFGWKVVTTSQWYGTVDTSAVYYPPTMKAAAQQLATDLDIATIKPAVAPMQMDQLTVILTTGYTG